MSLERTSQAISGFCQLLMSNGLGVDYVPPKIQRLKENKSRVTWDGSLPATFSFESTLISEYLFCVKNRQYNVLLWDAAFIQISYEIRSDLAIGHRLVYWPSPVDVDLNEFPQSSPMDVILEYVSDACSSPLEKLRLRSPWRFDYDPDAAKVEHPETHLTALHPECRIPVVRPLDLRRFAEVVFSNLHSRREAIHNELAHLPSFSTPQAATSVDESTVHIHWKREF